MIAVRNAVFPIALVTLCAGCLTGAPERDTIRPKQALLIADFETDESVSKWIGIACERTGERASQGRFGMRFDIPKWREGEEPRPGAQLLYRNGEGFPLRDWSGYKSVIIDGWVSGDKPGKLGLKLRDSRGQNSWTTHITVEPGKLNHAELSLEDAATDMHIHDVQEIVLYALRAPNAFTLTVDNLRLLPRDKPPLATFDLQYPNYRGLIFPEGGDLEVALNLEPHEHGLRPERLALRLSLSDGSAETTVIHPVRAGRESLRISPMDLPYGPATLTASLYRKQDGKTLREESWPLQKVSPDGAERMAVYIDRSNNTVVDGEPFFPVGWYGSANEEHLAQVAESPFNCYLAYGTNRVPKERMLRFLDRVEEAGLKFVYCMNDVYPTAKYYEGKNWEGIEGNEAIAAAVVEAYRDHPAMLAWYLNDELPRSLAPKLEEYYERVKKGDPNHPSFIVLCNRKDFRYLQQTTDILGGDTYPIPGDPVEFVSEMADRANEAVHGAKPVWMIPQAFAWYQYNSKNRDRSHTPTYDEFQAGRAPTREEARCMTYLALTHGAKGLIYYCYYDMRVLPNYRPMWEWMKAIGQEVKSLSPVLLSPDDLGRVAFSPATASIHTKLKKWNGRLYLLAVNSDRRASRVTFDLKRGSRSSVKVMFEDRHTATDDSRLTDDFQPLEVHVYDLGPGE